VRWLLSTCDLDDDLHLAVQKVLTSRGRRIKAVRASKRPAGHGEASDLPVILQAWWRGLCLDFHPDRGGDTKVVQALVEVRDRLKRLVGA